MNKFDFLKYLKSTLVDYKHDISDVGMDMWVELGEEFGFDLVVNAIKQHRRTPEVGMYFPQIAHVIGYLNGKSSDRANNAWSKVMRALREAGSNYHIVFDDPIIHQVISDMGGWARFCSEIYEQNTHDREANVHFFAKEFNEKYETYAKHGVPQDYPKKITADENMNSPFIPIGDENICKLVYKREILVINHENKRLGIRND